MPFEGIVRPVVFPNIRPQAPRVLPREDDPTKGQCVIRGNPGKSFDLSYSYSFNASSSTMTETERQFDEVRVYQKRDDGTVNKKNFVDVEVANRIKLKGMERPPGPADDQNTGGSHGGGKGKGNSEEIARYYAREIERVNIEIKKRDQIRKNEKG